MAKLVLSILAMLQVCSAQQEVFSREMLAAHNSIRARVKTPPLVWSARLAMHAQNWANRLLASRQFKHSGDTRYGENLYAVMGQRATPSEVVEIWASESRGYDRKRNSCRGVCGHYTQIVWRSTKEAGCAVARDKRREVWVCNYNPPGNMIGERPY